MPRPLAQLWLTALRAPAGFAFASSELTLVAHEDIAKLGAVRTPEMMNYRTRMPERNGLFSYEAFGEGNALLDPSDASRTDPIDHPRATTFGRIDLPVALIHPLALSNAFDEVALRLGMSATALRTTLDSTDEDAWAMMRGRLDGPDVAPLLIRSLLVLPAYLRPMVPLDTGLWAMTDVNDLYRRVVNRSNRLARLLQLGAPPMITNNEERMLYDAIDSLFANELREAPVRGPDTQLVSLWGIAGEDRFDALAEHERHAPLTRKRQMQLAAIRAMGFELRPVSATITASTTTLGVPL